MSTPRARTASRVKEDDKNTQNTHTQTHSNTHKHTHKHTGAILAQVPGLVRPGFEPKWCVSHLDRAKVGVKFCLCTDMPFKAGSPRDWLCKFFVTSSENPYHNNGFRSECR